MNVATQIVDLLNEALKLDPDAIQKLIEIRVSCNKSLADHPTIRVRNDDGDKVGLLGILNGLTTKGEVYITAVFDDQDKLTKFVAVDKSNVMI